MQNDRLFFLYSVALFSGMAAIMMLMVHLGAAPYPSFLYLVIHIVLSLAVRAAYKSWDGSTGSRRSERRDTIRGPVQEE